MFAGRFGTAGDTVVIEEFLDGEEASFIAMVDGAARAAARDVAGSQAPASTATPGPNTGGMGAYSPAPVVTPAIHERVMREVMWPTVRGARGAKARLTSGFLYAGLMIAADGTPQRARVQLPLRRPGNAADHDAAALATSRCSAKPRSTAGSRSAEVDWDPRAAVGVVLAAGGYPGHGAQGRRDPRARRAPHRLPGKVFHAGTRAIAASEVVTSGGRVLCAVGLGATVRAAQRQAYALASAIRWEGMQFRQDIGYRAIARE